MSKRVTDDDLLKLLHHVKARVAALPAFAPSGALMESLREASDARHAAAKALVAELVKDQGARLTTPLGGYRLAMAGVTTTCTSGESGLLGNWILAAYRELDRRQAA